jgi:hypothetical protein
MLNFPDAPTLNQVFTSGTRSWSWDGTKWAVYGSAPPTTDVATGSKTLAAGFTGVVRVENTSGAACTITLPSAPTSGNQITIKDSLGNATLYNITINGAGKNIEGAATLVLRYNYNWVSIYYNGVQWVQI